MVLWYVFQNMDKAKLHNELRKKLDDELKCLRFDHSEPCYDELEKCLSVGVKKSERKCAEITKKNVDVPVSTTTWQIKLFYGIIFKTATDLPCFNPHTFNELNIQYNFLRLKKMDVDTIRLYPPCAEIKVTSGQEMEKQET